MALLNEIAKFCLKTIISHLDDTRKLAVINLISSTLGKETEERKYGQVPSSIIDYETFYKWDTGGWYDPDAEHQLDYASVELEVGRFFYSFVLLTQPRTILETGVYKGYSTSLMAGALKLLNNNGHIYSIDPMQLSHLWKNTELEEIITWIPKKSQESLELLKDNKFDLLVLDSDHSYETIMWELINFEQLLREGGHIIMHDSLFFDGVGAAVEQLYNNSRFELITLDTPRKSHIPNNRCPGITIVRKNSDTGPELKFENKYKNWFVGDSTSLPYIRKIRLLY